MRSIIVATIFLGGWSWPEQPAPAPTLPPPTTDTTPPAALSPPGYPYSPGYAYPVPYPYAMPYPGYPSAYPQTPPAMDPTPAITTTPPAPVPGGRLRLGAALMFSPQGTLSYSLNNYRGESLQAFSGSTAATVGIVPFLQLDVLRNLYVAFAVQLLPTVRWNLATSSSSSSASSNNNLFGGSGSEIDFLPQVGITMPASRRIRLLAFAAPGYSLIFASNLVKVYADPGTAHGFVFQTGVGMIWSFGEHAFLDFRGTFQWGFQNNTVQSTTTGQSADVEVHSRLFGMQVGGGYWF